MSPSVQAIVLFALGAIPTQPGVQLVYEGAIEADQGEPLETRKTLRLIALVGKSDGNSPSLYWTMQETGQGGLPWIERFGQTAAPATWKPAEDGPTLLYNREDLVKQVSLVAPLAAGPLLHARSQWEAAALQYRVVGREKRQGQECWKIEAGNAYGVRRTLWVQQDPPLLLSLAETVFMGNGQRHSLVVDLKSHRETTTQEFETAIQAFQAGQDLRRQLGLQTRQPQVAWNDDQLTTLRRELPRFLQVAAMTPLAEIAAAGRQDLQAQRGRVNAIDSFRSKLIGQSLPEFQLPSLDGEPLRNQDLRNQVTVLHFWSYRDTPLKQPYGQVGYLDYLQRGLKDVKATVIGVSVDARLLEKETRGGARQAAKRLRDFMNLSYPIALDTQGLLKQIGDPRAVGSPLPLFLVLDPQGRVIHYSVGMQKLDRDRGLVELREIVTAALKKDQ